MKDMRIVLIACMLICLAGMRGCKTGSADATDRHPLQKYAYDDVRRAVKQLPAGTPRHEVMLRLGSPAEIRGNTWIYLPQDTGFLIPREMLEVTFTGGVFASYTFKPILFGQTP